MRKVIVLSAFIALVSLQAFGQLAATKFINLVDTPATVTFDSTGSAQVRLDATTGTVLRVAGYRKVSVLVNPGQATSFMLVMGKIAGGTLSQATTRPVGAFIQTFDVVGPEMALSLKGGAPGRTVSVELWVFLSS